MKPTRVLLALSALALAAPLVSRAEVSAEKCGLNHPDTVVYYNGMRLTERLSTYEMEIRFSSDPVGVEILTNRLNPNFWSGGQLYKIDLDGLSVTRQSSRHIDTRLCLNEPGACDLTEIRNELELAKMRLKKRWWLVMKDEPRESLEQRLSALECAGKIINAFVKRLRLTPQNVSGVEVLGGGGAAVPSLPTAAPVAPVNGQ